MSESRPQVPSTSTWKFVFRSESVNFQESFLKTRPPGVDPPSESGYREKSTEPFSSGFGSVLDLARRLLCPK